MDVWINNHFTGFEYSVRHTEHSVLQNINKTLLIYAVITVSYKV